MLQQVLVEGRLRRLLVFRRRSSASWGAVIALFAVGAVVIAGSIAGWTEIAHVGGSSDGTVGALVALAALCGGAVFIQRVYRRPLTAGFDPEGIYSPVHGWIEWNRVRRIEVRRRGNAVTGRRTVVWVAFLSPPPPSAAGDVATISATASTSAAVPGQTSPASETDPAGDADPTSATTSTIATVPVDATPGGQAGGGGNSSGDEADGHIRWLAINPGWSQSRTVELAARMERLWLEPGAPPVPAESVEAAPEA